MPGTEVDEEFVVDPDDLKMPESPEHRRVTDLIAAVAEQLLPDVAVYRDMNWYPLDGGNAVGPDVMTLPIGALTPSAKSYQQPTNGPLPGVVVEVVSASDSFTGFLAKTNRYHRLGLAAYIVTIDPDVHGVMRLAGGGGGGYQEWTGRPVPELADLRIDVLDGTVVVSLPDGRTFHSAGQMLGEADARAERAERRAAALEAQLRALGVDPAAST